MEAKFTFDEHAHTDALEEYAFRRLSEADTEAVEEHLLICDRCRKALAGVDDYILLMKEATARLASGRRGSRSQPVWFRWGRVGIGVTALAILSAGALTLWPSRRAAVTDSVQLVSLRGNEPGAIAHSRGGPLDLVIDVSDLPGVGRFRLEVVDATGRQQWAGEATPANGKLTVSVSKPLGRGTYWVRLSAGSGELLREFGLRAD